MLHLAPCVSCETVNDAERALIALEGLTGLDYQIVAHGCGEYIVEPDHDAAD